MNEVKLRGKYLGATQIKEVGTNGTKIRQFYVDISDNPEYPNTPEMQLINDKCTLVEHLTLGQEIEVFARLKGRKVVDKDGVERVYTNVEAWKINAIQRTSAAFVVPGQAAPTPAVGTFANPAPNTPKSEEPF